MKNARKEAGRGLLPLSFMWEVTVVKCEFGECGGRDSEQSGAVPAGADGMIKLNYG